MSELKRIDFSRIPVFIGDCITPADLNELYPSLAEKLHEDAVEETKATQTKKGYDTTGYGYQYIVNVFNQVLGPAHWRAVPLVIKEGTGSFGPDIAIQMTIQIGNYVSGEFVPIAERTLYGGHMSKTLADAMKGAFTNSFKKTAALFGVGRHAYEGSIDDDSTDPEGNAGGHKRSGPTPTSPKSSNGSPGPNRDLAAGSDKSPSGVSGATLEKLNKAIEIAKKPMTELQAYCKATFNKTTRASLTETEAISVIEWVESSIPSESH